nr:MAG: RNA-dependent RNA polymerase [Botourmiaviridae sp.]
MAVKAPKSRAPRGCRAYQRRTLDVVRRAVASWEAISGLSAPPLLFEGGSCPELAGVVKKYLASSVSDDEAIQMGFQSIKKLLPDSCRCMESVLLDDLVRRLGRAPRALPSGYLKFVRAETNRIFPKGWDSSYEGYCLSTSPPLTSCCEEGRAAGGVLSVLRDGQASYLDRVLHGKGSLCPLYTGKLLVVQSAGKPRPLTKFPAESLFLKPLHKSIYRNLSRQPWLLRGPPREAELRKAGFKRGSGVLVSGDYRSATDNLPIEVMEAALEQLLRNAVFVPDNVKELARRACRPRLFSEKDCLDVRVGQMMGSLLSFPLLCLQNYLSFRWAVSQSGQRGRVPVMINGDDILFQTSVPDFPTRWFEVVAEVGLEVEETKTSVEESFGSLNSTLLRWNEKGLLSPAWSPRMGMLRPADHPGGLGSSFLSFLAGSPAEYRFRAGRVWFDWHIGELRASRVGLPSLGFRGLFAKRLAGLFGVENYCDAELPPYFKEHGVGMCADFVSRVPTDALDEETRFASSVEVAAQKWTHGFAPADRVSGAIQYCLARSAVKGERHDYGWKSWPFWVQDREFKFRLEQEIPERKASRRSAVKPWLDQFPVRTEELIAASVADSLVFDLGRGPLPPYSVLPGPMDWGTVRVDAPNL